MTHPLVLILSPFPMLVGVPKVESGSTGKKLEEEEVTKEVQVRPLPQLIMFIVFNGRQSKRFLFLHFHNGHMLHSHLF